MSKELEEIKCIVAIHFGALGFLNPIENEQILKDRDKVLNALNELQSIKEANPSEALECLKHIKKYYIPEPCSAKTYDCLETIKQALIKAQEPKNYLKWEDLEFSEEPKGMKVRMNDTEYILRYTLDIFGGKTCFLYNEAKSHYIDLTKQFFNDLRLERVEE